MSAPTATGPRERGGRDHWPGSGAAAAAEPGISLRTVPKPAQVLVVAEELKPPPQDCTGRDLAGMGQRCSFLRLPADLNPQVNPVRWLAGERLAGLCAQLAGHRIRDGPGKYRHAKRPACEHGSRRGRPVIRMARDAGLVEDEQSVGPAPARRLEHAVRELGRGNGGHLTILITEQVSRYDSQLSSGLGKLSASGHVQVFASLVESRRLSMAIAQDVDRGACPRHLVDNRAEPERLIIRMRNHGQNAGPGRQPLPGETAAITGRHA